VRFVGACRGNVVFSDRSQGYFDVTLMELQNIFRSSSKSVRRSSQFLPAFLVVAVLVLGPLAIAAYACGHGGGGHGGGGYGGSHGGGSSSGGHSGGGYGGWHGGGGHSSGTPTPTPTPTPSPNPTPQGPGAGSGSGTPLPGGSSGSGSGPSTNGGVGSGSDNGASNGNNAGGNAPASSTTPSSTTTKGKTTSPSGGVVTEKKSGSDGKKHSSQGKINGKSGSGSSGSGSSGNSGSRAGSGVDAIAASAKPTAGVAVAAAAAASKGDGSGSGSGSNDKSGSSDKNSNDTAQKRTTIARAVDGIPLAFRAALLLLIFATSILAVVSFRERRRATSVARVAMLDHLTGLANREGFDRQMAIEWQRALRHGRPLGMVFVDLDNFKSFNDTNGHVAGDRLLREVAAAITATSRGSDFTARLGGDEFVVVCPDTDESGLERLIERLRVEAAGMAVSLSIGAATKRDSDEAPDQLVHRADVAMYAAKGGRRRGAKSANPMLGSLRRG
jgi:diguanylate cyclase (GGDEF)-like protein